MNTHVWENKEHTERQQAPYVKAHSAITQKRILLNSSLTLYKADNGISLGRAAGNTRNRALKNRYEIFLRNTCCTNKSEDPQFFTSVHISFLTQSMSFLKLFKKYIISKNVKGVSSVKEYQLCAY